MTYSIHTNLKVDFEDERYVMDMIHFTCLDWYCDLPAEYSQGTGCKCCIEHLLPFQGRLCIAELNCVHSSFFQRGNDPNRPGMTGDVSNQFYNMCSWLSSSKNVQPFWYTSELMNYFFPWDRSDIQCIYIYTIRPSSYSLWTWIGYPLHPPMISHAATGSQGSDLPTGTSSSKAPTVSHCT